MNRRRLHRGAPSGKALLLQWANALIAARKIGKDAVDPGKVQPAHHLDHLTAKLVVLIEKRGADQHAGRALLRECQRHFFAGGIAGG